MSNVTPNGPGPDQTSAGAEAEPAAAGETVFVARQPIFDLAVQLYGYEVLFRSTLQNVYDAQDGCKASAQTLSRVIHTIGLDTVADGHRIFLNFPGKLVLEELYAVLPPERLVVELLETAMPTEELVSACKRLKAAGYLLAVDDVTSSALWPLLELADVIKVDFRIVERSARPALVSELRRYPGKILAEKIDSKEDFDQAIDLGFQYVQGFFFCRPEVIKGQGLAGSQSVYAEFSREMNKPRLDLGKIEDVIKRDVSLTYKFLRYLHSAGVAPEVLSPLLRNGLEAVGELALRKWGSLASLTTALCSKPTEIMTMSLIRARFCEAVAAANHLDSRKFDAFLMGLLSFIDAIADLPMEHALSQLSIPPDVKAVLVHHSSAPKDLVQIHTLAQACERGAWAKVIEIATSMRLTQSELAMLYYNSMTWADRLAAA